MGRYVLERRLAVGGMAEVFLARQSGPEGFEKVCVVKRMLAHLSDDPVFVNMFLDEARLAARLTHPNIAQIFDFGHHEDAYYLAMEYVQGSNLHFVVDDHARRRTNMPLAPVLKVTALACAGLDFAHNATDDAGRPLNIIHRDISPHNIMLSKSGDVKLIDFGIAKATTGLNQTKAGTLKGKYAYMAPEQVMGKALDRRTDIYAMGLVLWELLANRPAIVGDSEASLMGAAARREFSAVETVRPETPAEVRRILEKALAMNMAERYESAGQMADDLEDFLARSGTRVRQTELAALLTPSTSTTGIGPILATPSRIDDATATNVEPASQQDLKPTQEQRPVAPVPVETPTRRVLPALAAIVCVVAAGVTTVAAYLHAGTTTAKTEGGGELVVPPPPPKPVAKAPEQPVAPEPTPAPTPAEPAPVAVEPAPVPAPTPKPVAAKTPKPKPTPAPTPAPTATPTPPKLVAGAKGTVTLRVLPYAEVYKDGTSLGVTPLKPLELDPGKYVFRFVNPETKKNETRTVTVSAGAQVTVKVDLR